MSKIKKGIVKMVCICSIFFSFIILDVGMRFFLWKDIGFVSYLSFSPLALSASYVVFLCMFLFLFKRKAKLIYVIMTIISNIYCLTQMIHFKILGSFFSLVSLFSAKEASDYLEYALHAIDGKMLIIVLLSIVSLEVVLILFKKYEKYEKYEKQESNNKKIIIVALSLLLIFAFRISAMYKLGKPVPNNNWDAWKVPRNVYNNFNNNNRSFMVSGMYEYIFRDIYLYINKKTNPHTKENIKEINDYINSLDIEMESNSYTGIFKDKNLIMIMLESIDDWLVTDEVMPTLKYLEDTGLNFENRYAPFYGGAMTINSEFASVSGIYSVTSEKAIYNYNTNNFDYSLPSLFRKKGYAVNSIHMNNGEFYNRKNFHKALGFENHYALSDTGFTSDFVFDTNIVLDDDSYRLIIPDNKFVTLITTYSAHVPYKDNYICDKLSKTNKKLVISNDSELSCLRLLANETDNFIKYLINRLDEDGLLNDTVIVLYADHYSYGYSKINEVKGISDNNLIQKTPLVIWNNGIEHKNINTLMDTADIPVTLFNMFDIKYDPRIYMGTDAFSSYHENFVYFANYNWYDGEYYYQGEKNDEYTQKISKIVNKKNDINGKIILSDFYKYYNE